MWGKNLIIWNYRVWPYLFSTVDFWHWHVFDAGYLTPQKWHWASCLNIWSYLSFVFNNLLLKSKVFYLSYLDQHTYQPIVTNYMSRISQIVSTIFLRDKMFWLDKNSIKVPIYIADCITKKADRNSLKKASEKCVEPFSSIRNSKYHCNLTIIS